MTRPGARPPPLGRGRFVGDSAAMRRVYRILDKVAGNDLPVLITGESGTGKEVFAQELHARSGRADAPFVAVNCAAIAETLFESELFGHERGAFTGATSLKRGRIEVGNGGTLFLDEIGEIPTQTQVKLLRFLQEKEFERVGGTQPVRVDVRVVAATNRDLAAEVKAGRFREDLFYRLSVIPVSMPPLRDRQGDVALLARHFAALARDDRGREKRLSPETLEILGRYTWPGNVRELQNVVDRAVILAESDEVGPTDLPREVRSATHGAVPEALEDLNLARRVEKLERELIEKALDAAGGDLGGACQMLGIKRQTLRSKLKRYGLLVGDG